MALGLRLFWSALSGIAGYFLRFQPAHPTYLTNRQRIHDYSNLALPTLDARNTIHERVPAPFTLVSDSFVHSRQSALVLGESGATLPANPNPHLPSPSLFQPPLAGVKPVANICCGLVGKDSAIFKPGIHYHRMPVKSGRRTTAGAGREESSGGA